MYFDSNNSFCVQITIHINFKKVQILYFTNFDKFLLNQKQLLAIIKALCVFSIGKKLKSRQLVILVSHERYRKIIIFLIL